MGWANAVASQDWGESDDYWSSNSPRSSNSRASEIYGRPTPHWSIYAGIGFTADPEAFLINFEVPYRFDRYVSAGPMMQVAVWEDQTIVAPTANVTLTIPDLPGDRFDRLRPNLFAGIGFAAFDNSVGFLINTGFGVDYQVSEHLSIGTRMIFNFMPSETGDEDFWYSWEIGGLRFAF